VSNSQISDFVISSDVPLTDPADDAYGYATFAKRIADAVCKTASPKGLVMAIHGPWGVGKSTLLNFVKYDIAQLPEDGRPIVIDFNPWWFNNREHLASQFLLQFRAKLLNESEQLRKIGDKLAEYSDSLGTIAATSVGQPWLSIIISCLLKLFKKKPEDVPALKVVISNELEKAQQRFVFIIDDIDRLAPNEICELFKVIKALADFPNVIYLLSFDRNTVAEALRTSLGVDGEAYLEKIIQAQFSLPAVDRIRLRKKFLSDLDKLFSLFPLRKLDKTHWGNVYWEGLDQYINKPRDIVRTINTLSVTYPTVAGEVNPTDFVALEFLRIFEADVYTTIKDNRDKFAGHAERKYGKDEQHYKLFHETWLSKVQEDHQSSVKGLVTRLFPKLEAVWNNMTYDSQWLKDWRRELRVCSPDIVDVYFQFGLQQDSLRRFELDNLLAVAANDIDAIQILESASKIIRPDGTSKAREYLERLSDFIDEITPETAKGLLIALFKIGDMLLSPGDEKHVLLSSFPNRWRLGWAVKHLLKRIPEAERLSLISQFVRSGQALGMVVDIVCTIEENLSKPEKTHESPFSLFEVQIFDEFKIIVSKRLEELADEQLLAIPDLSYVIHSWLRWTNNDVVANRLQSIFESEDKTLCILEKYLRFSTTQTSGDIVSRQIPRLNPKDFEKLTDISELESRVKQMLQRKDLTENQKIAAEQYLKGMELIREGKDPDGFFRDE
jgi:predicted KAP-like P-loop ATPase